MMPLLFNFSGWELLVIGLVIVLLFGGKKIPELMKGMGRGVRSFKEGLNSDDDDDDDKTGDTDKKDSGK